MTTALASPKLEEGPPLAAVKAALAKHEPEIAKLLERYETKRAGLLPVLHIMQREFGWLPFIVQREVARRLGLTPGEVSRVVSFYSLFRSRPCGKHVLMVCGTLSCEMAGANRVIKSLCDELGVGLNETTPDGKFTVERVECLGWCDKAPVMQVNERSFDDEMTPEKAKQIVRRLRDE